MEQELANTDYISIIRLLQYCNIDIDTNIDTLRLKKQLLAEFNLSATGFIEIDGFTYSKESVLLEIEKPDFNERLAFHKFIWEEKGLLQLLEQKTFDTNLVNQSLQKMQNNEKFDAFFSPYFASSYAFLCRNLINQNNFHDLTALFQYREFVLPQHQEIAFKPIRTFFDEHFKNFNNISEQNLDIMLPKIAVWINAKWANALNNLPETFFIERDDLVAELINLTVKLEKTYKTKAIAISNQLILLKNLNPEHKKIIGDNHNVFTNRKSSSESSGGSGGWWIVWVVILLLRLVSNGGCAKEKKPDYDFDRLIKQQNYQYENSPTYDKVEMDEAVTEKGKKQKTKKKVEKTKVEIDREKLPPSIRKALEEYEAKGENK